VIKSAFENRLGAGLV